MKKLLALLSMLTCGWVSAATSPVTFEEAVNVLVRSTQSAYVTPSGLAFRFCASEEGFQAMFRFDDRSLRLARELAPLKGAAYDLLARERQLLARCATAESGVLDPAALNRLYHEIILSGMEHLLSLADEIRDAILRAGLQPHPTLDLLPRGSIDVLASCEVEPCCGVYCGPCSENRCDCGVRYPDRKYRCESPVWNGPVVECYPPAKSCSVDEPKAALGSQGGIWRLEP